MTPRPRKASDEDVFAAAYRVMQRVPAGELTLAEIAAEAGLTAGALVQRFGSRRGLMVALMARMTEGTEAMLASMRAAYPTALASVRGYGECMAGMAESPATLAHHLAYLQMDLTDPEMHQHLQAQSRITVATIRSWLDEAVEAGELNGDVDTGMLARAISNAITGSMMSYAIFREGTAADWLRADVDLVLAPYLVKR